MERAVQTHAAGKRHSQDLNPDLSDSQLLAFPLHSLLVFQVGAEGQG